MEKEQNKQGMSKKDWAAAILISVGLAGFLFGTCIPFAIETAKETREQNALAQAQIQAQGEAPSQELAWITEQESRFDETLGTTVYALTPTPSYLPDPQYAVTNQELSPNELWDFSSREETQYSFEGYFLGTEKAYTNYLLTGKESYTVFITNSRESGTSINCYAYNASYGDRLIDAVIVPPGQTVSMVVDGLSASSEVFLEFTGDDANATVSTELSGFIN